MYFDWQADNAVNELKRMVDLRIPYPDIGRRFGVSTGAVCGKVNRLGIGKGPHKPDRLFMRAKKSAKPTLVPDAAHFEIMERQEGEAQRRQGTTIILEASEDHHCRYVIGDPTRRQLCGVRRYSGSPYCEEHARLCSSQVAPTTRDTLGAHARSRGQGFALLANFCGAVPSRTIDVRTFEEANDPEPLVANST